MNFISIHVVNPCSCIDITTARKKSRFILSDGSDFHKIDKGGARGVMVIVVGNGHGDTSSNPGRD